MFRTVISHFASPTLCVAILVAANDYVVHCEAAAAVRKKYSQTSLSPHHDTVVAVAQRLKIGLSEDNKKLSETTKEGVKIYYPKGGKFGASSGLMIAR
jgi:ethanolamine utilization cobalamin adenosyltransferase